MPRASLHFNLPEESRDFDMAQKAAKLNDAVTHFEEWLVVRALKGDGMVHVEMVRTVLREFLSQAGWG